MLDSDYVKLLAKLKKYFEWRNCSDSEDLAQETVTRGLRRLAEGKTIYSSHDENFFMGIARNVLSEERRKKVWYADVEPGRADERDHAAACDDRLCLAECLAVLSEAERNLLVGYIVNGPRETAEAHGITGNALRVRVSR